MSINGRPISEQLTVERDGARLQAWRHGVGESPVIVFVHGGWMDHRMFDDQISPVVAAGYQVLTSDLRGHGLSRSGNGYDASIEDMARDQLALLDAVEHTGPVYLVGQSLGGMIAQHVVLLARERIAGLVTIGAPCVTLEGRRIAAMMAARWWLFGVISGLLPESTIRRQLPAGTAVETRAQEYVRQATAQLTKREFRWLVRASGRASKRVSGYRIEVPVLITRGEHDKSGAGRLTALTAPRWAERDPRAHYEIIPDAGHQAHQDQARTFNRLLLDFLATAK